MIHGYIEGLAALERRRYPSTDESEIEQKKEEVSEDDQMMLAQFMGIRPNGSTTEQ